MLCLSCWCCCFFFVVLRQNRFKHLILNYLDDIELTDVIVQFYCLASIFFVCVLMCLCFAIHFSSSASSSLTYLREMIEQCLRACVFFSFLSSEFSLSITHSLQHSCSLSRSLQSLTYSIFLWQSIFTFIDRTIKTITVIKLE